MLPFFAAACSKHISFMARRRSETEDLPKVKLNREHLIKASRFLSYLKPHRTRFTIGMFCLAGSSGLSLMFPKLMGELIDAGTKAAKGLPDTGIDQIAVLLMGVLLVQAAFSFFRILLFVQVSERALADLRTDVYKKLIAFPMDFFVRNRVGEIHSRLSADITQIQDTMTTTLAEAIRQVIVLIGGIALLANTSGKLTLFMLAVLPVLIVVAVVFGKRIRTLSRKTQDKLAETNVVVEETLQAIGSVKSYTNERWEVARYSKGIYETVALALKGAGLRGAFASFIIFCLFGAIVAVIWYGSRLVAEGQMSVGDLTSFILYSTFVGAAMGSFAEFYAQIQKAVGATERVFEILDEKAEPVPVNESESSEPWEIKETSLEFKNVKFAYPSRPDAPAIKEVSFRLEAGKKLALVGPSGAGKSTLAGLLLRFYAPESGQILAGGEDIQSLDLHEWRKQTALVPQDITLFGGSIFDNIAYGKPGSTQEEVEEAARKANAHEFIQALPDSYQTLVGERGIKLSGGQRQRVAIARAILRNPRLLILDEATSSLDSESERQVQDALNVLMEGRTSIIIAHRLSTVRDADQIVVLDQGIVAESGTHAELMEIEGGIYRNLKLLQVEEK